MDTSTIDMDQLYGASLPDQVLEANLPSIFLAPPTSHDPPEVQQHHQAETRETTHDTDDTSLRNKLRNRILLKCQEKGQPIPQTDFKPKQSYELTPAEKLKKERRREQNRRAARKCRAKKKNEEDTVHEKYARTEKENQILQNHVGQLQRCLTAMKTFLLTHAAACSIRLTGSASAQQPVAQTLQQQQSQQEPEPLWQPPQHDPPPYDQQPAQHHQQPEPYPEDGLLAVPPHSPHSSPPSPVPKTAPLPLMHYATTSLSPAISASQPLPQLSPALPPGAVPLTVPASLQQSSSSCPLPTFQDIQSLPCNLEAEQPSLGSQGFDFICSQVQANQDLFLDSQELNSILGVSSQDHAGSSASNSVVAPSSVGLPEFLSSTADSSGPYWTTCASTPITTVTATTTAQSLTPLSQLPSSVQDQLQDMGPQTSPQPPSPSPALSAVSQSSRESELPDLPGFPFAQRRKRRSVDSVGRQGDGCSSPKVHRAATYPVLVTSPSPAAPLPFSGRVVDPPQSPHFTLGSEGGHSSATSPAPSTGLCDTSSPAPAPHSPFSPYPGRGTPSPCAPSPAPTHSPGPSPSPRSPCSFRFNASTPPPTVRCGTTTTHFYPITPSPSRTPSFFHSSSFPQQSVLPPVTPNTRAGTKSDSTSMTSAPAPSPSPSPVSPGSEKQQDAKDADGDDMSEDLINFLTSSRQQYAPEQEEAPGCTSYIDDLLGESLTSSQED